MEALLMRMIGGVAQAAHLHWSADISNAPSFRTRPAACAPEYAACHVTGLRSSSPYPILDTSQPSEPQLFGNLNALLFGTWLPEAASSRLPLYSAAPRFIPHKRRNPQKPSIKNRYILSPMPVSREVARKGIDINIIRPLRQNRKYYLAINGGSNRSEHLIRNSSLRYHDRRFRLIWFSTTWPYCWERPRV